MKCRQPNCPNHINLNLKMFKRSASKSATNEEPAEEPECVKPAPVCEEHRDFTLFGQHNRVHPPNYLQMPIKIESGCHYNLRSRKESACYQEELTPQNESSVKQPKEELVQIMLTTKDDVSILEKELKAFHMIDQDVAPEDHSEMLPEQPENESRQPPGSMQPDLKPQFDEELLSLPQVSGENDPLKRMLLGLVNDYQVYSQSLKIVMNFHILQRRDYMIKMFGNILGVIKRENRKMENGLCTELRAAGFGPAKNEAVAQQLVQKEAQPSYPSKPHPKLVTPDKNKRKAKNLVDVKGKCMSEQMYYDDE